jgi:hypothetical protein
MPLLYESYTLPKAGDIVKICFQTRHAVDPQLVRNKLKQYDWNAHGLQLLSISAHTKGGCVTVKILPSFIAPVVWIALAAIIPSAIGAIATIAKMWVIAQVTNPLLAPGPLGFPMVFWLIIASAGVLIPLAIILRRK